MSMAQRAPQRLDGAARVWMSGVQRGRLLAAAVEILSEVGYPGMSMARVTTRAGVSRRTFYDLFADREDCFLAVFDKAVARASVLAQDAAAGQDSWREQVRAGLSALLQFIGDEPVLSALVIVDALGAGPRVLARRAQGLEILTGIVDRGRSEVKGGREPPPLTAEGVVGAVLSVLHARLLEENPPARRSLVELLNPLMAIVVMPYLGPVAARKELERPVPKKARRAPSRPVNGPLDGLGMRVTYRTLRVLTAIAAQPGASNRQVAEHAEIADQGQVSRLLARLEKLGLVENTGLGQAKGEPNAWNLTAKGQQVEGSIRAQTGHIA